MKTVILKQPAASNFFAWIYTVYIKGFDDPGTLQLVSEVAGAVQHAKYMVGHCQKAPRDTETCRCLWKMVYIQYITIRKSATQLAVLK